MATSDPSHDPAGDDENSARPDEATTDGAAVPNDYAPRLLNPRSQQVEQHLVHFVGFTESVAYGRAVSPFFVLILTPVALVGSVMIARAAIRARRVGDRARFPAVWPYLAGPRPISNDEAGKRSRVDCGVR